MESFSSGTAWERRVSLVKVGGEEASWQRTRILRGGQPAGEGPAAAGASGGLKRPRQAHKVAIKGIC